MKVSIIITCYNLEKFIRNAIESLLNQRCDFDYEIIVIDDASTDKSMDVIRQIVDPKLLVISLKRNVGAATAINIGFEKARGKYVCRFDGDDQWYPEYLQKTTHILDNHPEVVLVHTDVSFINEYNVVTRQRNNIGRPAFLKKIDHEFKSILHRYYMNAPAIMARREFWNKVLPWAERFRSGLGDWFYSLSMVENDLSAFIDEPLAFYRIHTSNMHRAMIRDKTAEKNTDWILQHFRHRKTDIAANEWRKIYFEQNKNLGFAYFSHDMDSDARRCLTKALLYNPSALVDLEFARIWIATMIGKGSYVKTKQAFSFLKSGLSAGSRGKLKV